MRRFPKEMAGRVSTTVNTFAFGVMFLGQWGVGVVLSFWPQTPAGYAPEAYGWGLGLLAAATRLVGGGDGRHGGP